ncbi:MAG: hypothetical protein ACI35W_00255 [Anaeroplasmataceae bacterium]
MKLNFKDILFVQTDEKEYKPTIFSFIVVILCIGTLIAISNFIPVILLSRFIMVCLTTFGFYLIIAFIIKMIFISENIEKQRVRNKVYEFKFDPVSINIDDFCIWLYKYSAPEQIIIKLSEEYHYVEISYDTKGRRGNYINRNTYFDDAATKVEDIERIIKLKSKNGKIEVFETYDHQNPQILVDEINDLK